MCVKQTGKRRSKLDKHDFTGIFIGYTATDQNIRYVDEKTVNSCHHAVFDKAWYLHPNRPPTAQLLYNMGLCSESDMVKAPPPFPMPTAFYPPKPLTPYPNINWRISSS